MEDKKSLLKKLHALAERGDAGEREAAKSSESEKALCLTSGSRLGEEYREYGMKIAEATKAMQSLNKQIKAVLRDSGFERENNFYPDEYQTKRKTVTDEDGYTDDVADLTADEWQLVHEYEHILDKLDTISDRLTYLAKPITHEGELHLTERDRFAVDGKELCCGYRVEYQRYDKACDCYYWITDRVEHSSDKGGYYFYGSGEPLTVGVTVRIR